MQSLAMAMATSRNDCICQPLLFVTALLLLSPTRTAAWARAVRPDTVDRAEINSERTSSRMASTSNGEAEDSASAACHDADATKVPSVGYYSEYHGHTVHHLETVRKALSEGSGEDGGGNEIVYLMGDSTLDNKHWLFLNDGNFSSHPSKEAFLTSDPNNSIVAEAINGYENVLDPPTMLMDVCYWMNKFAAEQSSKNIAVINAAVEESTVSDRSKSSELLPQDAFVSKNLGPNDTLVVSVGGNDLALLPSERTQLALQSLATSSHEAIASGTAAGFDHVLDVFHAQVEDFVARVVDGSASPPRQIIVCFLYYPDETSPVGAGGESGGSWADPILEALGYGRDPTTVQLILKSIYEHAKERGFRLPPSNSDTAAATDAAVKLFPMFDILDGKDTNDYVQRVEPSTIGGQKIARGLLDLIL